jgi:hypothetical protein
MAYLTREEALAQLASEDSFLFGNPNEDVPMALLDLSQKGTTWTPLVPTEIVRILIGEGTIARDGTPDSTGKDRFRLARKRPETSATQL